YFKERMHEMKTWVEGILQRFRRPDIHFVELFCRLVFSVMCRFRLKRPAGARGTTSGSAAAKVVDPVDLLDVWRSSGDKHTKAEIKRVDHILNTNFARMCVWCGFARTIE